MPTTISTRPACWCTATARTSSTPTARQVFDYLSRFTDWRPYEHRVLARCAARDRRACWCRSRSTSTPSTGSTACRLTEDEVEGWLAARAETVRRDPHQRGRRRLQGRARALRAVLPRLHAQAMGRSTRSELDKSVTARVPTRTNRDDRYFTDTLPGHAARRLHARCSSACSTHPNITVRTGRSTSARCADAFAAPAADLDRADRRVFRLPLRQAALSRRCGSSTRRWTREWAQPTRHGELPGGGDALHAHHRIQAHDRAGAPEDQHHLRISRAPRAIPTTRSRARRTPALYKRYEALADADAATSGSSGGWPPIATTTWTRWSVRRWRPSSASSETCRGVPANDDRRLQQASAGD